MPYKSRNCEQCQRNYIPKSAATVEVCAQCQWQERRGLYVGPTLEDIQDLGLLAKNARMAKPELKTPVGKPFELSGKLQEQLMVAPFRICVLDIECTGLDASFGRVLCACAQFYGPNELKVWRADQYESWKNGKRSDDSALVADILAGVEEADIIFAHNGTNYDMPFLRTRAIIHGLPAVNPKKIVDPVWLGRRVFRFHSNGLEAISEMLDTSAKKTRVSPKYWIRAFGDGDTEALDYIVEHCIYDVASLAEIAYKMRKYVKQIDSVGSWRQ